MRFLTGVAVGAAAMYFFDPQQGAQRRARAQDAYRRQLRPTIDAGVDNAQPAVRELGGLVRGAASRVPGLRVLPGGRRDAGQPEDRPADRPEGRPAVMATLSETQMQELTRQFAERDRQAWDALTKSYGWSGEQSDEVWRWFGLRPQPNQQVGVA
jgi:hypothetical protein